ncbi:MAG: tRNA uridine-5-carboxymethylaminomethyl(34) synthesis GTPase MnmE [Lachnospiraceae bacterium]|jgi:tRNA modification GTPase|uniref:tRNA uridine-5-carboxymethylaminomethyl(34) synthesis GTPase MnmE n=1 Tax=Hominisplanchenecus murintestinalis TaxID=2941517 RepID=UPI002041F339|nr:tRNA uridine-5-carboxymethylaminomethyl(34) synthesis GTPase MnmE [Hominisplanchenecus murintestinalis]MCI9517180.1 tRNA uridine-5-carboxymethylaminomethyl(34) synthesis GTPase MnmE [Lachnospiraceae bacterium]MCI9661719.1 tRNA uridine-5-carboxymethylaminomethyl(34) synthesis GTPase MnmE [Lachnospiraceae bacterium]
MKSETIAAISTPMSDGGIGIIRISGEDAFLVADRIYQSKSRNKKLSDQPSHTIHYGYIYDDGIVIDEVLIMLMRAPRSFTAEDTVEINCHGGIVAMRKVLETVIKNGARPAEPGEFTKRAFLNGRMDLSQAEAVLDVIQAKNEYALKSSVSQLKGAVHRVVCELRKEILYHIAFIESALDDPEHISLEGYPESLKSENEGWIYSIQRLIDSAEDGRVMSEGIKTVIVGKPNVGKSSLLNILVGEERAIVTDIAGTTRDVLQESVNMKGITLNIADTAGIRDTEDAVERIGVDKAKESAKDADLVIYVTDASVSLDENDEEIINMLKGQKAVVLLNKTDLDTVLSEEILKEKIPGKEIIPISAKENKGIDLLEETLKNMFFEGKLSFNDEVYITNMRHKAALIDACESLRQVESSLAMQMPEDFYSIDLMAAYESLGSIIGEQVGEDLVDEIFGKFCMGK